MQTMADASGALVGHVVYDAFGGVLENTIPAELTSAYAELPDAASGLVHVGGGRWYDPALGRPLQPNPAGGAPTAPQTMGRYAATPLGQPGVAQVAASNPYVLAFGHQVPGTVLGLAIDLAPTSKVVGQEIWGLVEISYLPTSGLAGAVSYFGTSRLGQALTHLPFGLGEKVAEKYASRYSSFLMELPLDEGGMLVDELLGSGEVAISRYANARLLEKWEVPVIERGTYGSFNPWWKTGLKASGAAFIISAGFQLYDDWGNPYLTGWQKVRRAGISGGVSFASAFAGAGVGAVAGTATGVPIVGTVVGAVVGFGVGLWAELELTPMIFERTGNISERHLAPLP